MGYNKIIRYANTIETYTYGRHLPIRTHIRRNRKSKVLRSDLDDDGKDPLSSAEHKEKRQDNARRAALVFRRLVSSNLEGVEYPVLITTTYRDNQTDLRIGYRDFHSFIKALRHKFGALFRYIAVPEFQRRGAVHFHALFWGLPQDLCDTERHTRLIADTWSHGFVYMTMTDGNDRLSSYLTKYMAKSFTDPRLLNQKAYTCSRNIKRPIIQGGISSYGVESYLEECGAKDPVMDKSYDTHWLGQGRHRIYKLSTENPPKNPSENLSQENIESTIPLT
jgi:hypothetical protein